MDSVSTVGTHVRRLTLQGKHYSVETELITGYCMEAGYIFVVLGTKGIQLRKMILIVSQQSMDLDNTLSSVKKVLLLITDLQDTATSNCHKCSALVSRVTTLEKLLDSSTASSLVSEQSIASPDGSVVLQLRECMEKVREYVGSYSQQSSLQTFLTCKVADSAFRELEQELSSLTSQLQLTSSEQNLPSSLTTEAAVRLDIQDLRQALESKAKKESEDDSLQAGELSQIRTALIEAEGEYAALANTELLNDKDSTEPQGYESHGEIPRKMSLQQKDLREHLHSVEEAIHNSTLNDDAVHCEEVAMVGSTGVGKSALRVRIMEGVFCRTYWATGGVDSARPLIRMGSTDLKLNVWDTAGLENFHKTTCTHLQAAAGVMVVFDVGRPDTFDNAKSWVDKILSEYALQKYVMLVGNKVDVEPRSVSTAEAETFADAKNIMYIETSAKTGENVYELFLDGAVGAVDAHQVLRNATRRKSALSFSHRSSDPNARQLVLPSIVKSLVFEDLSTPNLQPSFCEESVSGWLVKLGGKRKNWKKRWFVLSKRDPVVRYYCTPTDTRPRGEIELNQTTSVAVHRASAKSAGWSCIRVACQKRTWYFLVCEEKEFSSFTNMFAELSSQLTTR